MHLVESSYKLIHLIIAWDDSLQPVKEELSVSKIQDSSNLSDQERLPPESTPTETRDENQINHTEEVSLISFETTETPVSVEIIRQPSPPPVLAEVQDLIPAVSPQVSEAECGLDTISTDEALRAESPLQLHIVRLYSLLLVYALVI